jgi:hypothetical protein
VISGIVSEEGTPLIPIPIGGHEWIGIIDSEFNGDLQLPESLRQFFNPRFIAPTVSVLANGQELTEDSFEIDFPFDGQVVRAETTFVLEGDLLVGTNLLKQFVLQINFPDQTVLLERVV